MTKILGVETEVGLAIEYTAGIPETPTTYLQWTDMSIQAVSEKSMFKSSRGVRNLTSNSIIKRKYTQGAISVVPNVINSPFFFLLALGQVSTALVGTETLVYGHTIIPQNAGASMKTATMVVKNGDIITDRICNVVVDTLSLECSNDYAKLTANVLGKFPDTSTLTASYTKETEFAYPQMTVKMGATLTAAASASPTLVKDLKVEIKNNFKMDEAFLSGSNDIVAGGLVAGALEISGSYTLHFADAAELAKYKANTLNAMIIEFTGAAIGNASTENIKIKLGGLILTKQPIEYKVDQVTVLKQEFTVSYDATDKECTVIVQNLKPAATYTPLS